MLSEINQTDKGAFTHIVKFKKLWMFKFQIFNNIAKEIKS